MMSGGDQLTGSAVTQVTFDTFEEVVLKKALI